MEKKEPAFEGLVVEYDNKYKTSAIRGSENAASVVGCLCHQFCPVGFDFAWYENVTPPNRIVRANRPVATNDVRLEWVCAIDAVSDRLVKLDEVQGVVERPLV
jgi:hypothetical protein